MPDEPLRITIRPERPPPPGFVPVGERGTGPRPPDGFVPIGDVARPNWKALGPSDDVGFGAGNYPPSLDLFRKHFGRDPATDTEIELYGPTGQRRNAPWHRNAPPSNEAVPQAQGAQPFSFAGMLGISEARAETPAPPPGFVPTSEPAKSPSMLSQAMEPFTSLPSEYSRVVNEAMERMGKGVEQLGTKGSRLEGAFNTAAGALDFTTAPLSAPIHTIAGMPLERNLGIPHQWTEFAAMLGIPGIGLASTAKGKDVLKPLEKILSPGTISPEATSAEASIRAAGGQAARDTATTAAEMEPYHRIVNAASEPERLAFLDYVEGRSTTHAGMTYRNPQVRDLADKLKTAMELRQTKLQNLPSKAQMGFVEDYFPHFWQDPAAASAFVQKFGGGAGKQGSGASLRKRTIPTIADGIAAGLKPLTTDPIEAAMRYVTSMDKFIASTEVLDVAKANGTVRYIRPKTMGASGHPDSFRVPDGWVAIKGRGATDATGAQAYAPADWARVYNNFTDRGVHASEAWGPVYDAAQHASNTITALELGLSGYHAFTMANEAVISEVARGISQLVGGKPIRALGTIVGAPTAPVATAMRGHKAEQVYLGRTPGTPDMRRIVDLQTAAGGRAVGKSHAADYRFSAMGSYWTAFKRGAIKNEMAQSWQNVKDSPVVGTAKEAGKMMGRIMETVAQPIFEKYIPKLKNGAFYDTMHSWLEANPKASYDDQVKAARQIWDSIDNRFGEMVQDNIFWNQTLKQTAQLAMRSYSWNMGTVREIGGGVRDLARGEWTPKASYVVALPIVVATMNAAYQYLKTGEAPRQVEDLVAGRTGGMAPGFGGRGDVEERIALPGYQKDVLGWYHDWKQEAANKIATGPRMVGEAFAGKDWRSDPIARPDADVPQWLADYFTWVGNSLGPISIRQLMRGEKEGSEISTPEMLMGLRPAPAHIQDPEGSERGMRAIRTRQWKLKQAHDRKTQQQYGGPQE